MLIQSNYLQISSKNLRNLRTPEVPVNLSCRYVNPVEAGYRILSKQLLCKSHSIIRLTVHLPQQQSIIINDIDDDVAVEAALNRSSTLLVYFDLNK